MCSHGRLNRVESNIRDILKEVWCRCLCSNAKTKLNLKSDIFWVKSGIIYVFLGKKWIQLGLNLEIFWMKFGAKNVYTATTWRTKVKYKIVNIVSDAWHCRFIFSHKKAAWSLNFGDILNEVWHCRRLFSQEMDHIGSKIGDILSEVWC